MSRPPALVVALAVAFLLLVASLVLGSFGTPELPPYTLTPPPPASAAPVGDSLVGPATYTLDASHNAAWRRFNFARNAVVESGPWDIAFRRNKVIAAPGAGVMDLGPVDFAAVVEAPPSGYAAGAYPEGIGKWYDYSMLSHLLTSRRHVYAVRTVDGRFAKLEILAYYCRDAGTACYTFRYVFQGDGSRRFATTTRPRTVVAGGGVVGTGAAGTEGAEGAEAIATKSASLGRKNLEHARAADGTDTL